MLNHIPLTSDEIAKANETYGSYAAHLNAALHGEAMESQIEYDLAALREMDKEIRTVEESKRAKGINREDIARTVDLIWPKAAGSIIELRVLGGRTHANERTGIISGYYNDREHLLDTIHLLTRMGGSYYLVQNEINQALLGRRHNRAENCDSKGKALSTGDKDIIRRRWIYVDFDPTRPSGISATDGEKAMAREKMVAVRAYLAEKGFSKPVVADSGNGYHLLYAIDMANDENSAQVLKGWLEALDRRFSDAAVKIDTSVHNASRLVKLYGTLSNKGDDMPDRPHRVSGLLEVPAGEIPVVDAECFERFITENPAPAAVAKSGSYRGSGLAGAPSLRGRTPGAEFRVRQVTFDMERFLDVAGIGYSPGEVMPAGRTRWVLDHCAFDESHRAPDAAVFQAEDGTLGYKCFHDSCSGKGWREFRSMYDEEYMHSTNSAEATGGEYVEATELIRLHDFIDNAIDRRKNMVTRRLEYRDKNNANATWGLFTDTTANTLKDIAAHSGIKRPNKSDIIDHVDTDFTPRYHPINDYLRGLAWDGEDYIGKHLSLVETEDDDLFREYFRCWTLRVVEQALTGRANDLMLILSGAQGIGKTTFAKTLVPKSLGAYYYDRKVDPTDKDSLIKLATKWIICDDELNGLRKTEVEAIKGMLSTDEIDVRMSYDRYSTLMPRLASFIGGTNEDRFLIDQTGNRRFLAIRVNRIDWKALLEINIDGLWAQVMHLDRAGERGRLSEALQAKQAILNEEKMQESPVDYYLDRFTRPSETRADWKSSTEIAMHIASELGAENVSIRFEGLPRQIGLAMSKRGIAVQKTNGSKRYPIRLIDRHESSRFAVMAAAAEHSVPFKPPLAAGVGGSPETPNGAIISLDGWESGE